jgi:hypothetical protein
MPAGIPVDGELVRALADRVEEPAASTLRDCLCLNARRRRPLERLTATERAQPVLDLWREPESFESSPVLEVRDPTPRTLEDVIAELGAT